MNDINQAYADAVMISTLTEEKTFLEKQLETAELRIMALYEIIQRHEAELRKMREKSK